MSRQLRLVKAIAKFCQQISKQFLSTINRQIIWLLRTIFGINRRRHGTADAGFVLPTVAMVSIVVILLTAAILFRSFERSKNASNVRVNEVVLRAAGPALDRAKAKIDKLFQDPRLPRSTPSDYSLSQIINDNIQDFTFGDEIQLKLVKEVNGTANIQQDEESLKSVWKYPVDTDNNGKFDSFTLYGIYFRTPTGTVNNTSNAAGVNTATVASRPRSPLEARAQPMDEGLSGGKCASNVATSADLVGSQGWYKVGSKLKRSIFVYTTTVPITETPTQAQLGTDFAKYEKFPGNRGFTSLEYQQDRERSPLTNNAVIYENDLEIAPGGGIRINGRVFTNGNLLTRNNVRFYQVSSPYSCYFTQENSKIQVAGNVIPTRVNESSANDGTVQVDFFKDYLSIPSATRPTTFTPSSANINSTNKTVPESPTAVYGNTAAFNDSAYAQRIDRLVTAATGLATLPKEVQDGIASARQADATLSPDDAKQQQLEIYFKKRTRRVPYAEVGIGGDALKSISPVYDYTTTSPLLGSGESLRPVDVWVFPFNPSDGKSEADYGKIGIKAGADTNKIDLAATDPATLKAQTLEEELRIGDRVLVGNNLPQYWYDNGKFVTSDKGQNIVGKQWNNNTNTRQRFTQSSQVDDFGATGRDRFWELAAAQKPTGPLDVVGGLRVVTGAGIYLPDNRTPATVAADFTADRAVTDKVWSDSMPMGVTSTSNGLPYAQTPYLKMRATAVYHYQDDAYDPKTPTEYQTPIACIATYYDPTNSTTAKNRTTDNGSNNLTTLGVSTDANGKSLNGIVYSAASLSASSYTAALNYQASLKYPNGRWVNKPLRDALGNAGSLSLSEQSAIDSAVCALKILDGTATISAAATAPVPHGAIRETAFLDARQVKAIDKPYTTSATKYDLDVELRQPLEIRATVLDLNALKGKSKSNGEFLFPNSGIIYATRDDALPDLSSAVDINAPNNRESQLSSTDFKLDPTRRPNGIMLVNGGDLSRNSNYVAAEKGLILVSDLPVYIKGNFNLHTKQEFKEDLVVSTNQTDNWSNFYTRGSTPASDLDPNFACRPNQFSSCTTGETWRPATVLADAITVLSGNFQDGFRNEGDYYLNDNYGNFPIGYDFNGDGTIGTTSVNLDETALKVDINGNGNMTDTSVPVTENNITATVAARLNGFWDNNFVTSFPWKDDNSNVGSPTEYSTTTAIRSSYFNNFVTPVQRRASFPEYVMEICRKPTVTACQPGDWVIGYDDGANGSIDWTSASEKDFKATDSGSNRILTNNPSYTVNRLGAGTTARPALNSTDRAFPRRVAFLRDTSGNLILDSNNRPIPLGVKGTNITEPVTGAMATDDNVGQVNYYLSIGATNYTNGLETYTAYSSTNRPRLHSRALWFITNKSGARNGGYNFPLWVDNSGSSLTGKRQPLLLPVLQIQYPKVTATTDQNYPINDDGDYTKNSSKWMQIATAGETNVVFAQGDTPGRPPTTGNTGETNGGLENFIRFLENWQGVNLKASGSFIQFKRSSYATAPWQAFVLNYVDSNEKGYSPSVTIFGNPQGYRVTTTQATNASVGRTPFYVPPNRVWGYDVALLTQLPDLFSQRFSAPSANDPNEFYREVGRDDAWVKTLLCAAQVDSTGGYGSAASGYNVAAVTAVAATPTTPAIPGSPAINYNYAVPADQRPSTCPVSN
jgi:hypothetical protein